MHTLVIELGRKLRFLRIAAFGVAPLTLFLARADFRLACVRSRIRLRSNRHMDGWYLMFVNKDFLDVE